MSGEKTEQPTEKKKEDAVKKGQVALSKDAQTFGKIFLFYIMFFALLDGFDQRINKDITALIRLIFSPDSNIDLIQIKDLMLNLSIYLGLPLILICIVAALASTWIQIGFVIAPEAIIPSFKKFDFVSNVKQMFSKKSLIQLLISVGKIVVLVIIAYLIIRDNAKDMILSYRSDLHGIDILFVSLLKKMIFTSLIFLLFLSVFDWVAVYMHHKKSIMMSKNEVKDETKQSYGDPQTKQRRSSMHRNLINSSLSSVSQAKAIVANPTHIAVALDYEPGKHDIPFILAMGADEEAMLIRKEAEKHGIPIIESVYFARQLYADCEENQYILEEHFKMAAEIFKLVFSIGLNDSEEPTSH